MQITTIGIAELSVVRGPNALTTLGLGSCVGLILYDRLSRIGGMAHIMLPKAPEDVELNRKAKYADTAMEELLRMMITSGASPYSLTAKLAGGAHMFNTTVDNDIMKVGQRNVEACHKALKARGIPIIAEDTGGNMGRTITLDCDTGMLNVRTVWPKTEKNI